MKTNLHKFLNQGAPLDERHGFVRIPRLQPLAYHFDQTENTLLFHMDGDDFRDQTKNTIFSHEATKSQSFNTIFTAEDRRGFNPKNRMKTNWSEATNSKIDGVMNVWHRGKQGCNFHPQMAQIFANKNSGNFDLDRNQNNEISHSQEPVLEDGLSHRFGLVLKPISAVFNSLTSCSSRLRPVRRSAWTKVYVRQVYNAFKLSAFSNKPLAFLFVFIRVHPWLKFVLNAFPRRFSAPFAVKMVLKTALILLILNLIHVKTAFSQTASLPYTTGFESSQSFSLGAFPATGNVWRPTGTVSIVNTPVFAGTQSLAIAPNGLNASRIQLNLNASTTTNQIVFADFYLQGVVGSVADLATITTSNSAVMMVLVQTGAEAELYVANGLGNGTISQWVATGRKWSISGKSMTGFKRVTARIDLVTQSWDLFLEGTPAALDIGFPRAKTSLSFMNVRGDAAGTTRLDNVSLATTNPLFADLDKDGMDDAWETANGLSTATDDRDLDKDGDGLTNLQEFVYGTRANVADTDGDGISDSVEIANATNPNSELTVTETFENYVLNSLLAGQGKWTGSGTGSATVQATTVKEGSQAVKISGTNYALQRVFATTEKGIWTDFYVKPVKREATTNPSLDSNTTLGVYFDGTSKLRVFDGTSNSWQTVTSNGVNIDQWQRLTVYHDYTTKKFSVWLNNVRVAESFGFKNLTTLKLSSLKVQNPQNGDTYLDRLSASTSEPTGLDNDGDGLTNAQEIALGTNPNSVDFDGDGVNDGAEVTAGTNPFSELPYRERFESFTLNSSIVGQSKWTATGTGSAIVQNTEKQEGTQGLKLSNTANYKFQRTFITSESEIWIDFQVKPKSFAAGEVPTLDSNIATAFYFDSTNKLRVYNGTTASWQTVTTTASDLTQWQRIAIYQNYATKKWSIYLNQVPVAENLGFVSSTPTKLTKASFTPGARGDVFMDDLKITVITASQIDADNDGLLDSWEIAHFGNLSRNGTLDFDGDGYTDKDEFERGSDPKDANSKNGVIFVKTAGDDTKNGFTLINAKKTVNNGVSAMISGDTLQVEAGSYTGVNIQTGNRVLKVRANGTVIWTGN